MVSSSGGSGFLLLVDGLDEFVSKHEQVSRPAVLDVLSSLKGSYLRPARMIIGIRSGYLDVLGQDGADTLIELRRPTRSQIVERYPKMGRIFTEAPERMHQLLRALQ